jgi:hypothetical protein
VDRLGISVERIVPGHPEQRLDRIDEVFVRESALVEGDHARHLPMYISFLVKHALDSGMYRRDELPREALIVSTLGDYLGEVDNGGHAQFVGNVCWCVDHRGDIREGLAILGLNEAACIFADLEAFAERKPRRFARNCGQSHEQDPYFRELDRRFHGPVEESIDVALRTWIKTRPWLRTMPDEDYFRIPGWETPNHTLREARREERRRSNGKRVRRSLLSLRAGLRSRRAKGLKRWLWRLLSTWYSRG